MGGFVDKVQSVMLHANDHSQAVTFSQQGDVVHLSELPQNNPDNIYPVLTFECDSDQPELYLTGGMRVPKVKHPPYDPCPSDIMH